ncbi:MAG TPA: Uma2 family endonuclease [Gemmatimonadaceae bacterium]|jgi:Uma2 family endonuclease
MAMAVSVPRYTIADLERLPNDGNRYELLDGVLLVTPAPSYAHQIIVSRLQFRLMKAVMVSGDAHVVGPGAITVPPKTQLEPDILVFPARYPIDAKWEAIDEHWLAVEVLSRSSRVYDREIKRDAYIALGVQEVWLVDRWNKSVEVSRAGGRGDREGDIALDVLRWRVPTLSLEVEISLTEVFAGL